MVLSIFNTALRPPCGFSPPHKAPTKNAHQGKEIAQWFFGVDSNEEDPCESNNRIIIISIIMYLPTALWYPGLAAFAAGTVAQCISGLGMARFAVLAFVWYGLALVGQHRTVRRDEPPVVWSWFPFIGSAVSFGSDTIGFIRAAREAHGPAFTVIIAGSE